MSHKRIVAALFSVLLLTGLRCTSRQRAYPGHPEFTDSLLTVAYDGLYKAIYTRNPEKLKTYLSDHSKLVSQQAWRAFASTPVDSIEPFIRLAEKSGTKAAWFGISMHPLSSSQLRGLEKEWQQHPEERAGISLVLGRQGDEHSLDFLTGHLDLASGSNYEYNFALAIGRLVDQFKLEGAEQERIIRRAFAAGDPNTTRAYLYGWYRNSGHRLSGAARDSLFSQWKLYGMGHSAGVDQYIARLLWDQEFYELTLYYHSEETLARHIQLAIELAQALKKLSLDPDNSLAAKVLLTHPNPVVVRQTLTSLEGKLKVGGALYDYITRDILPDTTQDNHVWLEALKTAVCANPDLAGQYSEELKTIERHHPYLEEQVMGVLRWSKDPSEYLDYAQKVIEKGSPVRTMAVLNALYEYWASPDTLEGNASYKNKTREMVFSALAQHDRGTTYMARELLENKRLFGPDDFSQINQTLKGFRLPEDIEVFQVFGALYKDRFEKQAKAVIHSWASKGYVPLNQSLRQAGWDVEVGNTPTKFREPDWNRLLDLGPEPIWVLETPKGVIEVRMNTLIAPATVSVIDSLTRSGDYDGIPFHRVVPNFVIQGGDVERRDGFGGPGFIIPTEATGEEFVRGAAGIASAGTDTEGSQYFFMHQWKPHLNGRYTLFGKVEKGLEVIDKIEVGDKVKNTYWLNR